MGDTLRGWHALGGTRARGPVRSVRAGRPSLLRSALPAARSPPRHVLGHTPGGRPSAAYCRLGNGACPINSPHLVTILLSARVSPAGLMKLCRTAQRPSGCCLLTRHTPPCHNTLPIATNETRLLSPRPVEGLWRPVELLGSGGCPISPCHSSCCPPSGPYLRLLSLRLALGGSSGQLVVDRFQRQRTHHYYGGVVRRHDRPIKDEGAPVLGVGQDGENHGGGRGGPHGFGNAGFIEC